LSGTELRSLAKQNEDFQQNRIKLVLSRTTLVKQNEDLQ